MFAGPWADVPRANWAKVNDRKRGASVGSTTADRAAGQFPRAGAGPGSEDRDALTDAEAALLARARATFRQNGVARLAPADAGSVAGDGHPSDGEQAVEPALIGQILVDALAEADDPAGVFAWPSGSALWSNRALDGGTGDRCRPFMELLDEWSQARFIVRALPVLVRTGRWRGQLGLVVDGQEAVSMSTMLIGHRGDEGELDAFSLVAHRVDDDLLAVARGDQHDSGTRMLAALVQHVNDLIIVVGPTGAITFASSAATSLLGLSEAAFPIGGLLELIHPEDRPADLRDLAIPQTPGDAHATGTTPVRLRVRGIDDSWRHLDVIVTDLTDNPAIAGIVVNARDVTDDEEARRAAAAMASRDELTGLPDRARLLEWVESATELAAPGTVALLLVDLDHFRRFNETHGAAQTDAALVAVSKRLASAEGLGEEPFVARLRSDEFAVVLTGIGGAQEALAIAERLRQEIAGPLYVSTGWEEVTASIGVAVLGDAATSGTMLTDADWAMRRAKDGGRNRVEMHDGGESGVPAPHRLHQQLAQAVDSDGVGLWYQPVFDIATDRVVGAEALLRVRGEQGELLSPGAFIEAAESHGLIARLGASVLRTACREIAARGTKEREAPFEVSVNVSPRQIADPNYALNVVRIMSETGFSPSRLLIEITEGAFLGKSRTSERNIVTLRDIGVRVGLDDFGGGSASLGHLRRFPLDFVKIDRSLVVGAERNHVDSTIVHAAFDLAHGLGLMVTAVGVETEEQLAMLRELGCHRAQGFLFAPAVCADELSQLVP
jgi:diguanylate cyclase (GGDEF)-like protein/PAS domain S-box-containing protein